MKKRGPHSLGGPELRELRMEAIVADNAALQQRIAELEGESLRLRAQLAEYGRHIPDCSSYRGSSLDCSCGFRAALAPEEKS